MVSACIISCPNADGAGMAGWDMRGGLTKFSAVYSLGNNSATEQKRPIRIILPAGKKGADGGNIVQ